MHLATLRPCLALPALLLCALTACDDPASPPGPRATGSASLSRDGPPTRSPASPQRLVTGLQGAQGSTIGPGGALFVTRPGIGDIVRIDRETGAVTTFASGLPITVPAAGIGGAFDVAFIGRTAYVLVTLVGEDVGGRNRVGIYRVDGPTAFTLVADIGAYSLANPPETPFFIPTGVQYALEAFRGGFLVTDGHHNRVLFVRRDGEITELIAFGNVVPTGLATLGNVILVSQAGPVPHLPENGRIVALRPKSSDAREVASGARLLVDVEFGRGRTLFALSQGVWNGVAEGSPALPNTGALVRVNEDGAFEVVADGLDRPTSLEIVGNTAYVVTLGGEVWTIDDVDGPRRR